MNTSTTESQTTTSDLGQKVQNFILLLTKDGYKLVASSYGIDVYERSYHRVVVDKQLGKAVYLDKQKRQEWKSQ